MKIKSTCLKPLRRIININRMRNLVTVLIMVIGVFSLVSFKSIKGNTITTENIILISDYCDG